MKDQVIKLGPTVADLLGGTRPQEVSKREFRGRGNQGDWAGTLNRSASGTLPQHVEHNAAVEAKKLAKRRRQHEQA
jgi:hypothetical protein